MFSEGLAIDYKWFDKWDIKPRFEFGFGLRWAPPVERPVDLSYTSFELAGLAVREVKKSAQDTVQPTNERHDGEAGLYDVLVCLESGLSSRVVGGQGECDEYWRDRRGRGASAGECFRSPFAQGSTYRSQRPKWSNRRNI